MRDPLALEQLLAEKAPRMDFFHVLRLIENAHPRRPRIGTALRVRDDAVRFGQDPSMLFHATMLGQFTPSSAGGRARLAVNFFGLLGANGPLPLHLTDYARARLQHSGDTTLRAFLDVFHHRLLSLFYRARAASEPVISLDRADGDRFSVFVGSLFGIGAPGLRERDVLGDSAKLHYAGLLANQARPAAGLVTILRDYFQLPLHIEQFVGHWLPLSSDIQTHIGWQEQGNRLGVSSVLGRQVWDRQHKFRIVIGPLDYADFCRFLPGSASVARLQAWVKQYLGSALEWDLSLLLKKEAMPALSLGKSARLGWNSWLMSAAPQRPPAPLLTNPNAASTTQDGENDG